MITQKMQILTQLQPKYLEAVKVEDLQPSLTRISLFVHILMVSAKPFEIFEVQSF